MADPKESQESDSRIPGLSDVVDATAGRALDVPGEMADRDDSSKDKDDASK